MSRLTSPAVQALFLICLIGLIAGCKPSSEPAAQGTTTADSSGENQPSATEPAMPATDALDAVPLEPAVPAQSAEPPVQQTTLAVGDPAPSLAIGQWLKGEPINAFDAGHVYVVEFWATWCGPCRVSMPHISTLQDEYSDEVTFVGISDENEETVRDFMSQVQNEETQKIWDEVVTYAIALDDNEATGKAYMQAAGQNGIPTAFVVGSDGHVEWIGHPMAIDEPLKKIVAGEWDREQARSEFLAAKAVQDAINQLSPALREAQRSGDWSVPLQQIDQLLAQQPELTQLQRMKLKVLLIAEKYDDAHVLADELAQQFQDDPMLLNEIAWSLVSSVPPEQQNTEIAMRIAKQASSLRGDQDPSTLDTVARIYYQQGNLEEAIAWQKKAVEFAPEGSAGQLQATLEQYESELTPAPTEETEEAAEETPEETEPMEEEAAPRDKKRKAQRHKWSNRIVSSRKPLRRKLRPPMPPRPRKNHSLSRADFSQKKAGSS